MRKVLNVTNEEIAIILDSFYSYFEDGYSFELFLKIYLERIGLDEVFVTSRSNDGGIDLTAVRNGVGEFNHKDAEKYYIQAKRYDPKKTISPEKIRALRGSFGVGKGIFITTAKVSDKAKEDATSIDPQKPIIVIDGEMLVRSCIENEIGFVYKPVFSKDAMDDVCKEQKDSVIFDNPLSNIIVEKKISNNDIRARILRIPRVILDNIDVKIRKHQVTFNEEEKILLTLDKSNTYFAGVTDIYRKYNLYNEDGSFNSANSIWKYNGKQLFVYIEE